MNLKSGSLYIAGCPGSGKTMAVKFVIKKLNLDSVFINCVSYSSVQVQTIIRKKLKLKKQQLVIVLDEIDNIKVPKLDFPLVSVIGIANKIQIRQRTLFFEAYKQEQIKEILKDYPISTKAIDFISRKSQSFDMRWTLSLVQSALSLKTPACIPEIHTCLQEQPIVKRILELSLNAQIALCTFENDYKKWKIALDKAFEKLKIKTLNDSDFKDLCSLLEVGGFITIGKKIVLKITKMDIQSAVNGGSFSSLKNIELLKLIFPYP